MTRRRWIADQVSGNRAALTGAHAEHLIRVLRAHIGQEFDIAAGEVIRRGRIVGMDDQRVEFELAEEVPSAPELCLTLALAIFKFDRMEWAIEKCTELGAAKIVPVIAQRTDAHLAAAAHKRVQRWQRIARDAAEQSRRLSPPAIANPIKLRDALALPAATRIVLAESETQVSLNECLRMHSQGTDMVLAVGPEGGWTEGELRHFRQENWVSASLGRTILRAETAAIAALAVVAAQHSTL